VAYLALELERFLNEGSRLKLKEEVRAEEEYARAPYLGYKARASTTYAS
jgi:hypothetical protein